MPRQWSLRTRVTVLCVLVATVLTIIAGAGAATAVANRSQYDVLLNEIGPMRTGAQQLQAALLDQETGVRGYALRGEGLDLEPYTDGLATQRTMQEQIRKFAADRPEVLAQIDEVVRLSDEWRRDVAEPVIATVRTAGLEPAQLLLNDNSRSRFDAIRSAMTTLQDTLQRMRDANVATVKQTSNTLIFLLIIAAALVVLAGIGLLVLLHRLVTRPVTDLASEVRLVAKGDYERAIRSDGPPEVARLARDVDAMRRQIASDLSQVQQIRRQIEAANTRLEAQAAELTRSNRDLEQFAYVASHDLQEPLRKVASFCQLLQRRYAGQMDERADQYIAFAVDGAQRMQRLINDLLAFSRIGRVTSDFVEVDLDRTVADAQAQLDGLIEETGAQVTRSGLPVVLGEESLLGTLVTNLISNSIKFRRPDVPPRVDVSGRQVDGEWEITVADNGIGVEAEYKEKVFVIFQRLHAKDAYPGTGIGLAVAKKIVEYHGGRIWIESTGEPGATIHFTLPVVSRTVDEATPEDAVEEERQKETVS